MRCRARSRRRESQQGFALLLVFLMAAIVALMLYQQLPRVAQTNLHQVAVHRYAYDAAKRSREVELADARFSRDLLES